MVQIISFTQIFIALSAIMTLLPAGTALPTSEQLPIKRNNQAPVRLCDVGLTACYIGKFPSPWKRSAPISWECVDVENNIETCGGCQLPVDGGSVGKDCTDMEGINEVTVSRTFLYLWHIWSLG